MSTPNSQKPREGGFRESELASNVDVTELHAESKNEPVSIWLIVLMMGLMFFGGMFLWANSGGFQSSVYNANAVSWSGAGGGPGAAPDPMVIGKRVFTRNCAVCHQGDGQGVEGQFPPLAGSAWVLGEDWHGDNHMVAIVLNGLQGPVNVGGKTYNNVMAPWGPVLSDGEIAAVLTYVRNSWGNEAPPVPVEFVTAVREKTADRKDPWTEKDLRSLERELVGAAAAPSETPAAEESKAPPAESEAAPATETSTGA